MNLKYLFFPVVLFLAAIAFWLFIWPAAMSLQTVNAAYKVSQQNLLNMEEKKATLEKLTLQIKSGEKNGALAISYLPAQKVEEKIIGQINYIAGESKIFLNNLQLTKIAESTPIVANLTPVNVGIAGGEPAAIAPVVANTQATVTVAGDYDNLKVFFDGIQRMPLFNSVKSLEITSAEKKSTDPAVKKVEYVIAAKLVIDFGYLSQVNVDNSSLKIFEPTIDTKVLDSLAEYTTKTIPNIETGDSVVGVANPFLP